MYIRIWKNKPQGEKMNSLVIFDSQFGNTEKLARAAADTLKPAGKAQAIKADAAQLTDLKGIDLLVLASATVAWNPLPAMQAFLGKLTSDVLKGMSVACFDTIVHAPRFLTSSAARKMKKTLQGLGVSLLVPAMNFYVKGREGPLDDGEVERVTAWAQELIGKGKA
jgi:flavodoxin